MLLLYIRSSILYFYNIWSLLMFSHEYTDRISSSDVVRGDPFWEPSGLQRRRLPQVLGTGGSWHHCCHQFACADAFRERTRLSWRRMHSLQCKPPKAGLWSGGRTLYYKLPDVSPSFLCGLLQIGPDLGMYLLPCVDPSAEWLFCTGSQRMLPPAPIMLTGC